MFDLIRIIIKIISIMTFFFADIIKIFMKKNIQVNYRLYNFFFLYVNEMNTTVLLYHGTVP